MPNNVDSKPNKTPGKQRDFLHTASHIYFAIGIAALIGMLVSSYLQATAGIDALKQYGLVNQQGNTLDQLRRLLLDAESATRGYVLTHDPYFLRPYGTAIPRIHDTITAIEKDFTNSPKLHSSAIELISLAKNVTAILETTITQVQNGLPIDHNWLEVDNLTMETYRSHHIALKQEVLTYNALNVERSAANFQNSQIITVLLALVSLILLILSIFHKQKKQELQEKINDLLQRKNEKLEREVQTRTQELTNLATYLTNVRETEKLNLARELHDELGALLTAAKLDADWVERNLPADVRERISKRLIRLRQTLTSGITLKRRITNDLRPALLNDLGLLEALNALARDFQQSTDIKLDLELPETEPELSEDVSLSLFRITQEAFTNIQNYAKARRVKLSLSYTETTIKLLISDDGIGFDMESPKLARHGLAGIKHRVFTHNGTLDIRSAPDEGTSILAELPI
ncbi:MAG: CHASE3 domain-containing protein [Thiobacillus sp.]|nr:CHASE3 domain-containing protein [Thiobacillus sp.]